jgi:twitching motility protein PilT
MNLIPLDASMVQRVASVLRQSPLFSSMPPESLVQVAQRASVAEATAGEVITREGEPAESFFVLLGGEASVLVKGAGTDELVEVGRLHAPDSLGEIGLLLEQPRTATVTSADRTVLASFDRATFMVMYEKIPGFGLAVCRGLARRLSAAGRKPAAADKPADREMPKREVLELLPVEFMQRHRVVPLRVAGSVITIGFALEPDARVVTNLRPMLPGMDVRVERLDPEWFDEVLRHLAGGAFGAGKTGPAAPVTVEQARSNPRLDAMLKRMVAEGASDLHLSGGQAPRWRIDGQVQAIAGAAPLGARDVKELFEPVMEARHLQMFDEELDVDFAYAVPGVARFRVNLFHDRGGVGAVLRVIPTRIITLDQLAMPAPVAALCNHPKGLVLVTGPTGSGKSTTLAAMVDHINQSRASHIITMEDPIEFVHQSGRSLVNQREVGSHAKSFQRALRAALREDPDIVLVGEMRDRETVSLALETANTGHLVLGTLHTSTAASTVDRIVDIFPPDQQAQIRAGLAESLRGVVAQNLCRKMGGGRVAAVEVLTSGFAVANLIREGKTHLIGNHMSTNKAQGNVLLNESLAGLVTQRKVEFDEALAKSADKPDLARRLNRDLPQSERPVPQPPAAPRG